MKKILSLVLAIVVAISMSVATSAASVEQLGTDDFDYYMSGTPVTVNRTVKSKKGTFKVMGLYFEEQGPEVLKIVNQEREAHGLKPLKWEEELKQAAVQRALEQYMFRDDPPAYLSHTRPSGEKFRTVNKLANGENLARGGGGANTDAESVMDGWMNSPPHREAILDEDYSSMAVACVETDEYVYWVQLFHSDLVVRADGTKYNPNEEKSNIGDSKESIVPQLNKAKTDNKNTTVKLKYEKIPVATIKEAASWGTANKKTVALSADTMAADGKSAQGQITFNPANFVKNKNGIDTGVYVEKSSVSTASKAFAKANPKTKFAVIKLAQSGSYGGKVSISAKVALTELDTKTLHFYFYDTKTGKTTMLDLGKAGYSINKSKFLNFATSKGGYIVVTDKELA